MIGASACTNATFDVSLPYTTVNQVGCDGCSLYNKNATDIEDFASYDPSMSQTYTNMSSNLTRDFLNLHTLYDGTGTYTGSWANDVWANYSPNNTNMGNFTFLSVTSNGGLT